VNARIRQVLMHDALRDCSSKAEQATRSNCRSPNAEPCTTSDSPRSPASAIPMSGQEELGGSLTEPATAGQPSA
jgi:hypothetical protein